MLVDIDYQVPKHCEDCKFQLAGSGDFGRTWIFRCSLTGIGDDTCEGYSDQNRVEKRMREECPFLK